MKSFFSFKNGAYFSRAQRIGVVVLLFFIMALQFLFFLSDYFIKKPSGSTFKERPEVLAKLDSLSLVAAEKKPKKFTYNPNYITDERAYSLEMSTEEYDRLKVFREQGKFVNSDKEFQEVTGVSNDWLVEHSPDFKFPEWVLKKQNESKKRSKGWVKSTKEVVVEKVDINKASKEQLMAVRGIGEVLSDRVLNEREKFGAFVSIKQFEFIWGILPEVALEMEKHFIVQDFTAIKKVNINKADRNELKMIPYLNYGIALEIIKYRSRAGDIKTIEELEEIKNIPLDKLAIINLYLDF